LFRDCNLMQREWAQFFTREAWVFRVVENLLVIIMCDVLRDVSRVAAAFARPLFR
jgi:hypothetical protein